MFKKIHHIHFVGIGGSGMSGIAEVLLKLGYTVTGSDLTKNREAARLETLGAKVWEGHDAKNIEGAHVVVTSTAVSKANPEVVAAMDAGIPVIPRIEMLAEIARLKYTIAIAGTHGKTTTSSMVGQIFKYSELDPTVIVGGRLKAVGTGGVLGKGDYLVAEADESDGSFLKLSPTIAVVTNIDNDHLDYYKTVENLENAFVQFSERIPFYGLTFLCVDDPGVQKILPRLNRRFATYGFSENADLRASNVRISPNGSTFSVYRNDDLLGDVTLPFPGRHNIQNALAAIAVALHADISFELISKSLMEFGGVGRRMELKGIGRGVIVIDDYGHHPTEMAATLSALKERYASHRLVVFFQPHRYSRTQNLVKEFAAVLDQAELVYLLPIYPAGEKPIEGISTESITQYMKGKNWTLLKNFEAAHAVLETLDPGDVLLTLGAGDVWKLGEEFLQAANSAAAKLKEAFPELAPRIKANEPLSRHCTWAIGGPAEAYVDIQTTAELKSILKFCQTAKFPFFILGWGSNVLLPDEGIKGVVVRLRGDFEKIEIKGAEVHVGAGVHLPRLSNACAEKALAGVEALAGVPGTVGGALMTNAGTPRGVIGDVIQSVTVLNSDGTETTLKKSEIKLGYRTSNLVGKWILKAVLTLRPSQNGDVRVRMEEELKNREKTQPLGTKNVGSVFRNPANDHAARLIEMVGLKGKEFGRVRFSPKHANFMENLGGASAKEALDLIQHAQKLVKEKFDVDLHPEVNVVHQPPIPPK